jgi:nitrous oxidase accessory protein
MQGRIMKKRYLVIGIILSLVCMNITSSFAFDNIKKSTIPFSDGNTLYVGGTGPDNYTSIQSAINDANPGDTVFVYDDSSPYVENIVVDTSIYLLGEEKNTTIIDGATNGNVVNISADNVSILGFTIRNCSKGAGICIYSNNSIIGGNIVSYNMIGIETYYVVDSYDPTVILSCGYNTITNNLIIGNEYLGIGLNGKNNTVNGNIISQTQYVIMLTFAVANNLSNNFISENEYGIFIVASYSNVIYRNNISKNEKLGVSIFCTSLDKILQNNFIKNGQNAYFNQPILTRIQIFKNILSLPIRGSTWNGNFWDRPRLMPCMVPGLISLIRGPIMEAPYHFNIFQFDRHPAKKPYDIPMIE